MNEFNSDGEDEDEEGQYEENGHRIGKHQSTSSLSENMNNKIKDILPDIRNEKEENIKNIRTKRDQFGYFMDCDNEIDSEESNSKNNNEQEQCSYSSKNNSSEKQNNESQNDEDDDNIRNSNEEEENNDKEKINYSDEEGEERKDKEEKEEKSINENNNENNEEKNSNVQNGNENDEQYDLINELYVSNKLPVTSIKLKSLSELL